MNCKMIVSQIDSLQENEIFETKRKLLTQRKDLHLPNIIAVSAVVPEERVD